MLLLSSRSRLPPPPSLSVCLSVSVSGSLSLSLCVSLCLSLSLTLSVSLSVSLCPPPLSLFQFRCLCMSVLTTYVSVSVSLSLFLLSCLPALSPWQTRRTVSIGKHKNLAILQGITMLITVLSTMPHCCDSYPSSPLCPPPNPPSAPPPPPTAPRTSHASLSYLGFFTSTTLSSLLTYSPPSLSSHLISIRQTEPRKDQEEGGELDSQEEASPEEIKNREVVLGYRERVRLLLLQLFPNGEAADIVFVTLFCITVGTAIVWCCGQCAVSDGHCLNILLFWRRSMAALVFRVGACFEVSLCCPLSHSSRSLIGLLASVDVKQRKHTNTPSYSQNSGAV